MSENSAFLIRRAQDNVLRLAREWSKANTAWVHAPADTDEEQEAENELFKKSRQLHDRLKAACHELVALEDGP